MASRRRACWSRTLPWCARPSNLPLLLFLTSAALLPRAALEVERVGGQAIPYLVDVRSGPSRSTLGFPGDLAAAWANLDHAAREHLALLEARPRAEMAERRVSP